MQRCSSLLYPSVVHRPVLLWENQHASVTGTPTNLLAVIQQGLAVIQTVHLPADSLYVAVNTETSSKMCPTVFLRPLAASCGLVDSRIHPVLPTSPGGERVKQLARWWQHFGHLPT